MGFAARHGQHQGPVIFRGRSTHPTSLMQHHVLYVAILLIAALPLKFHRVRKGAVGIEDIFRWVCLVGRKPHRKCLAYKSWHRWHFQKWLKLQLTDYWRQVSLNS